jgi:hypothetical protein
VEGIGVKMDNIYSPENEEWAVRFEEIAIVYNSVHDELQELIDSLLYDRLVGRYTTIPAIDYYLKTGEMTEDALYVILPVVEAIYENLGLSAQE